MSSHVETENRIQRFAVPNKRIEKTVTDQAAEVNDVAPRNTAERDIDLARSFEILADRLEQGNKRSWSEKYGGHTLTCIVVLLSWGFGGLSTFRSTEGDFKTQNAVLVEQLKTSKEELAEQKRLRERDERINSERYVQIRVALEAKGIRIPPQ